MSSAPTVGQVGSRPQVGRSSLGTWSDLVLSHPWSPRPVIRTLRCQMVGRRATSCNDSNRLVPGHWLALRAKEQPPAHPLLWWCCLRELSSCGWDRWGPGMGLLLQRVQGSPGRAEVGMAAAFLKERGPTGGPQAGVFRPVWESQYRCGPGVRECQSGVGSGDALAFPGNPRMLTHSSWSCGVTTRCPEHAALTPLPPVPRNVPVRSCRRQRIHHAVLRGWPGGQRPGAIPECDCPPA